MKWDQISGEGKQFYGKVKTQWGKLLGHEPTTIAKLREQLIGFFQESYGYDKDQAEKELNKFTHGLKSHTITAGKRQPL